MAEAKAALLEDLAAAAEGDLAMAVLAWARELYPDRGYGERDLARIQGSLPYREQKRCEAGQECAVCNPAPGPIWQAVAVL